MSRPCPTAECWSVVNAGGSIGVVCTSIKCRPERKPETRPADWPLLATVLFAAIVFVWARGVR